MMNMKYFALASLILAAGCTANNNDNVTTKQANDVPARISTNTRTTSPSQMHPTASSHMHPATSSHSQAHTESPAQARIVTQASSTSSSWNTGKLTAKGTQDALPSELLDLIQGAVGNRTTGQSPTGGTGEKAPAAGTANGGQTGQAGQGTGAGQNMGGGNAQTGQNEQTGQNASKDSSAYAQQVLDIVNQERSKAGLNALSMDGELSKMAMAKAKDMYDNNYFDHNSPTHGSPFDMMKEFGITYQSAGENIAKGQTSPSQVMKDWMNSPGHKANILNKSYTHLGIAFYNNEWVQEFTG